MSRNTAEKAPLSAWPEEPEDGPSGSQGHSEPRGRRGSRRRTGSPMRATHDVVTTNTSKSGISMREYGQYRELFYNLTLRELRSKYKRSVIGWGWSMINPLANMAIYTIVFSYLFNVSPPLGIPSGVDNYALMYLVAMLPWTFFQGSVMEAMGALLGNQNLIQKTYFPREMIPASTVASKLVSHLIEMALVLTVLLVFADDWRALVFLPGVIITLAVVTAFTLGLAFMFSVANVFYRDVQHFSNILFFIWMFLTPVAYPYYLVGGGPNGPYGTSTGKIIHLFGHAISLGTIFKLNPMTDAVLTFQAFMYDGEMPSSSKMVRFRVPPTPTDLHPKILQAPVLIRANVSWADFLYLVAWAIVALVVGLWLFRKYEARLPEEL